MRHSRRIEEKKNRVRLRSPEARVGNVAPSGASDRTGAVARRPGDPRGAGERIAEREGRGAGCIGGLASNDVSNASPPPGENEPPPPPASAQPPPPNAQFSPDGRWWWNGWQWVPVPQQPPPFAPGQTATNSFLGGMMGCLGVAAAIIIVLIVIAILAAHH